MNCIFVDQPIECLICLKSRWLQCVLNRQHLIIRPEAKAELLDLFLTKVDHPDRYKTKSGEAGRKH